MMKLAGTLIHGERQSPFNVARRNACDTMTRDTWANCMLRCMSRWSPAYSR